MKPLCGNGNNTPAPLSYSKVSFCGVTEQLSRKFTKTQQEVIDEFIKDPQSNWIAGSLPKSWLEKIGFLPKEKQKEVQNEVFMVFRAAIKHLKPYCAPKGSKEYSQHKADLENKRIKEASHFLTRGLRKFGILPETNSVNFQRLKVTGSYTQRAYLLREKGTKPTLEKLFIKKFTKFKADTYDTNYNGRFSEIAHGLYLNKKIKSKYIAKFHWGDTKAGYLASEYATLPKYTSPIVKFKKSYNGLQKFSNEFFEQTGIKINELIKYGIKPGKINKKGMFEPYSKEELIIGFLQAILHKHGLSHNDLYSMNAIIGSDKRHKPLVKLVDIGGVSEIARQS